MKSEWTWEQSYCRARRRWGSCWHNPNCSSNPWETSWLLEKMHLRHDPTSEVTVSHGCIVVSTVIKRPPLVVKKKTMEIALNADICDLFGLVWWSPCRQWRWMKCHQNCQWSSGCSPLLTPWDFIDYIYFHTVFIEHDFELKLLFLGWIMKISIIQDIGKVCFTQKSLMWKRSGHSQPKFCAGLNSLR